jgi:hypothetical protein
MPPPPLSFPSPSSSLLRPFPSSSFLLFFLLRFLQMKRISIKDSEAAVTKGSQALLQADASMTKRVAAKAAAKQKRRLRSLQIRPTFVHPYHSFKALDNDERIMSATQGVDEGYIGFQDTEAHFQADLPGAKGDPTDSIAAPGSGQGEGEMGYGETEVQGRR